MALTISRDLSTDKQNRVHLCVSQSTWSHFNDKKKNFNHTRGNGNEFSFLTSCQFPDLPIVFCECRTYLCMAFYHVLMEIYSKSGFIRPFTNGNEFSFFEYLHKQSFWWRHMHDSWLSIIWMELSVHILDILNFSIGSDAFTLLFWSI